MELKKITSLDFYNRVAGGVDRCLSQQLKIAHGRHYLIRGHNSVRVITIRLEHLNPGYLRRVVNLRDELTMFTGLSEESQIRITYQAGTIILEIPKPNQFYKAVTLDSLGRLVRPGSVATLGLDIRDNPARLDFAEEGMAHVFITGQTRSGKTNTQRLIAWNLADHDRDGKLIIFDVAKRGYRWGDFGQAAALCHPVITEIDEAGRVLAWLNQEIERRADERRVKPKLYIVIDELKALIDECRPAESYLSRLASVGGEFGLHLILSTQYPQIKMLGSAELKRNVATRLCGRVDDANAAQNALGVPGSGAETLQGRGDFLLRTIAGLVRLAVVKVEPAHVARLPMVERVPALDLPDSDATNAGPRNIPDDLEPAHVALALFQPMGINKLGRALGIGNTKAGRVKNFADAIRRWAATNDVRCLPDGQDFD